MSIKNLGVLHIQNDTSYSESVVFSCEMQLYKRLYKRKDRQTDRRMDGQMEGQTDGWMDGRTNPHREMRGCI